MNILAAIQMLVNSNPEKPLNVTLDEINDSIGEVRKATRKVKTVVGIPYNATNKSQVLTLDDTPVFSIEGHGRILQILPICNQNSNSRVGTVLLTVDGEIILNNGTQYSYPSSDMTGLAIVNNVYHPTNVSVISTAFGASNYHYFGYSMILREDASTFDTHNSAIITLTGIPFKNGFDIRLTQAISTDTNKAGVIVVYELYE